MIKRSLLMTGTILVFFISWSRAQSISPVAINSSGGTKLIGTDTYEWSVAEMTLVSTATSPALIVTQGFLQPTDGPVSIDDIDMLSQLLTVYPNPGSHIVYLGYNLASGGDLSYTLRDVTGKRVAGDTKVITAGKDALPINLSSLANATYTLHVVYQPLNKPQQQTTFKIDKIN